MEKHSRATAPVIALWINPLRVVITQEAVSIKHTKNVTPYMSFKAFDVVVRM